MEPFRKDGVLWSRRGDPADWKHCWTIKRAPTNGRALKVCILSGDLLGTDCHFVGRRTVPCMGDQCEACAANLPSRRLAYFCAYDYGLAMRIICEVTAKAEGQLDELYRRHGNLRGLIINLRRRSTAPNGTVFVEFVEALDRKIQMPPSGNISEIMSTIWRLKGSPLLEAPSDATVPMKATGTDYAKPISVRVIEANDPQLD